eukprot:1395391-Amorphochlora_amoeboformis.AAC.1
MRIIGPEKAGALTSGLRASRSLSALRHCFTRPSSRGEKEIRIDRDIKREKKVRKSERRWRKRERGKGGEDQVRCR